MTDDRFDPTAADGELLSAYLAGDLDDAEAADLERRLADEPQLAAALDALADALVALGGFDDVEPPAGYEQRLADKLLSSSEAAGRGLATPAPPADLAAHRQRRLGSSQWLRIGTVAAVLAAGTIMAGTVLRTMGGGDAEVAMDSAGSAGSESAELNVGTATRPSAPVILDNNVKIADEEALRRRYSTLPEAQALLGVSLEEATDLAMVFEEAVTSRETVENLSSAAAGTTATADAAQAAEPDAAGGTGGGSYAGGGSGSGGGEAEQRGDLDDGGGDLSKPPPVPSQPGRAMAARPKNSKATGDRCLDAITKDANAPLVPVRVETLRYAGRRALSYVLVTSTPGSDVLDRTEVWVVRQSDCATIVFQQY